jgi:alanine racemase
MSNKGRVLCNDMECGILGRVCMDLTIIDLSKNPNPKIGDEVIIFGNDKISANEVAMISETIPYDIVCGISKRVKRIYK